MLMTEMWMPFQYDGKHLIYGDMRFMADDIDNNEGNIGLGYRQYVTFDKLLMPEAILGSHLWLDRRRTINNSTFYQYVIGTEVLTNRYDLRMNAYVPLTGTKQIVIPNTGSKDPYLSGTGIYYDTHGFAIEEPQYGYDVEIGYRVDLFPRHIESFKIYAGTYQFRGKHTEPVSGWRSRMVMDITPSFSLGLRMQQDTRLATQSYIEATIRFPFTARSSIKTNGLHARMDESPERDIDIITNVALIDDGRMKPVLNAATGKQQRILHVDNTLPSGGDGSIEMPYRSLSELQPHLLEQDIVYVHYGDGTTKHNDKGFIIDKNNVALLGAGTGIYYDKGTFRIGETAASSNSSVLIQPHNKNSAITNHTYSPLSSQSILEDGHGLVIHANNVLVSGLDIQNSKGNGIHIASPDSSLESITLRNLATRYNSGNGVYIGAEENSLIQDLQITDMDASQNGKSGLVLSATTHSAAIDHIYITHSSFNNNGHHGISLSLQNGSSKNLAIHNNNLNYNHLSGINISTSGHHTASIILSDNQVQNNFHYGLFIHNRENADLSMLIERNIISDTGNDYSISNSYAAWVDHDSTGLFNIDMGGGTQGSSGYNYFTNNRHDTLFLDTRPGENTPHQGLTLSARYNHWGNEPHIHPYQSIIRDDDTSAGLFSFIDLSGYLF